MKSQVVIKIYGGLGNQLFQYFFAKSIELQNDVDVFFDTSYFNIKRKSHERVRLGDLDLPWLDVSYSKLFFYGLYRNKILKRLPLPRNFRLYREGENLEWRELPKIKKDIYFDGYWQSYKYLIFNNNPEISRLYKCLDKYLPNKYSNINFNNAVSIHVRRGDYLYTKGHSVLDVEYYNKALNKILENIKPQAILVFSDDIEWSKKNINTQNKTTIFVTSTGEFGDIEELSLMRMCANHITANSTFSWWAAWLSWQINKGIIITPKTWMKRAEVNSLSPNEWLKI